MELRAPGSVPERADRHPTGRGSRRPGIIDWGCGIRPGGWIIVRLALALTLSVCVGAADANGIKLDGNLIQGGLALGSAPPGTGIRLNERPVRVADDGGFVFGFGRDAPPQATLHVRYPDGSREAMPLQVRTRRYETQRINGLPDRMVTPSAKALTRIRQENSRIAAVRRLDTDQSYYRTGFVWPVIGTITGVYGSRRMLNGEPRRPHYGIDIAADNGTPVHSPADGIVALAEADLYFTGGTVMIDHGFGVTTVLSHLDSIDVGVGQPVRQGDVVGTVGATGRVTGPHLDWRVNWFEVRLDPALLVPEMPKR